MEIELNFTIERKELLNSNTMTGLHHIVKGKMSANLRNMGYQKAFDLLPDSEKDTIEKRKILLDSEANGKVIKGRITKKIKKNQPELTAKELKEVVDKEYIETVGEAETKASDINITPLFNKFIVKTYISSPTARRVDPANFYPSIKNLLDGMTDAGFWIDDDWEHLTELSFAYDGKNDTKSCFGIRMVIKEVE